jgi:hypothetical protein
MSAGGNSQPGPDREDMPGGGAAQDTGRTAALERRYRRLLRCYPACHRQAYREEMLGVLIAGSLPGQRWPRAGESAYLLAAALVIRLRRAAAWLTGEPWQEAFAALSVIAPVLMLATLIPVEGPRGFLFPLGNLAQWSTWEEYLQDSTSPLLIAWLLTVMLALAGRRRVAAAIAGLASGALLLAAISGDVSVSLLPNISPGEFIGLPPLTALRIFTGALAFASLAFSGGPRRGLTVIGPMKTAALAAALAYEVIVVTIGPGMPFDTPAIRYLAALVVAVLCLRGPAGRRLLALAAPTVALTWLQDLLGAGPADPYPWWGSPTAQHFAQMNDLISGVYLALAAAVLMLAIASRRGYQGDPPFATAHG